LNPVDYRACLRSEFTRLHTHYVYRLQTRYRVAFFRAPHRCHVERDTWITVEDYTLQVTFSPTR